MKNKFFNSIASQKSGRNRFDLSRERKQSMKMGKLTPVLLQEVVPGDEISIQTEALVRLAPLQAPVMHRIDCRIDYYFVANRLIWNEWEEFITGGDDGLNTPSFPRFSLNGTPEYVNAFKKGTLSDYLGLPVYNDGDTLPQTEYVSALPFRAYQLIFNEFYRDQNLVDEVPIAKGSGIQSALEMEPLLKLQNRAWEKDYFTSALPDTQKGPEVTLPIGGEADIKFQQDDNASGVEDLNGNPVTGNLTTNAVGNIESGGTKVQIDNSRSLYADLESATAVSINELRKASALQKWLELAMRGGSRYTEMLFNFFGVKSSDARLQRPEYLGGGKKPVVISEVVSTYNNSDNAEDQPVGEMYGHGVSMAKGYNTGKKYFEEHGYIIGLMTVLPRTAYQQGLNRTWFKFDKFDHYFPQFANLGEQPVYNKELMFWNSSEQDDAFGYQQRYAEYKYADDTVHGDFRDELDYWHMGRKFATKPSLNEDFITSDPDTRIFQVIDEQEDHLWCQIYHKINAKRKMPYHANPQLG